MPYLLNDIYIGNFPITQNFGDNEAKYWALYKLKGHNGTDHGCPSLTPIISAADGFVSEIGSAAYNTFDAAGYGNYIKIVHDGYLTLYAHLNDIQVKKGQRVVSGQLLGHSNNTGNSDAPHLHFGVAPCDANGVKTLPGNGYSGYIDSLSPDCKWVLKNLTAPVDPNASPEPLITISIAQNTQNVTQGANYKTIASYLVSQGINTYLTKNSLPPIDLTNNPTDARAGDNIVSYLADLIREDLALKTPMRIINKPQEEVAASLNNLPEDKKNGFFQGLVGLLQTVGILTR